MQRSCAGVSALVYGVFDAVLVQRFWGSWSSSSWVLDRGRCTASFNHNAVRYRLLVAGGGGGCTAVTAPAPAPAPWLLLLDKTGSQAFWCYQIADWPATCMSSLRLDLSPRAIYTLAESRWLGVPVLSPFATSHAIGRSYAANVPSASPSFVHDLKPTELDRSRKMHSRHRVQPPAPVNFVTQCLRDACHAVPATASQTR